MDIPRICTCISRPTTPEEQILTSHLWLLKIRSSCLEHFNQYPARLRLNIMIRELTEGE